MLMGGYRTPRRGSNDSKIPRTDPLEQRIVILGRGEAMSARPETIDDYLATVSDEKRAALGYCGGQFGRPRPGPKSASAIGFHRSVSAAGCS